MLTGEYYDWFGTNPMKDGILISFEGEINYSVTLFSAFFR